MFEGLALGSRIAPLRFNDNQARYSYLMAAAYAVTTPTGMAIGLGVRTTYDPNSQTALLSSGIFDSLSAGLLIYNSLVTLLADDFIHGEILTASTSRIAFAIGSMMIGAGVMSLLGRWA